MRDMNYIASRLDWQPHQWFDLIDALYSVSIEETFSNGLAMNLYDRMEANAERFVLECGITQPRQAYIDEAIRETVEALREITGEGGAMHVRNVNNGTDIEHTVNHLYLQSKITEYGLSRDEFERIKHLMPSIHIRITHEPFNVRLIMNTCPSIALQSYLRGVDVFMRYANGLRLQALLLECRAQSAH